MHFSNFHDIYTQLDNNHGAIKVIDPLQISNAWEKLRNKEFRKKTLSNAHKILFAGSQKEDLIATILRKFEA
jgi:3-deoxy-D-manno-octulosonic-acid transferase